MSVYLGTQKVQVYAGTDAVRVFAGRPDYLIFRGKLVWADPKIYLQSSGTQYIDSGVYPTGTTTLDCSFSTGVNAMVFGARQAAANKALNFFVESGRNGRFDYNNKSYITNSGGSWNLFTNGTLKSQLNPNDEYYFEMTDRTSQEKRYATVSVGTFTSPAPMALFACNTAGNVGQFSSSKIYYFKIYQNGVLTRYFVPVPSGLVIGNTTISANGMFDIVSQTPYYNDGSGSFSYGKEN